MSLQDLGGAFNLIVMGFLSSGIILGVEILIELVKSVHSVVHEHELGVYKVPSMEKNGPMKLKSKTLKIQKLIRHRIFIDVMLRLKKTPRRKK